MKGQFEHAMLPDVVHDEEARMEFVTSFKVHVLTGLQPGNKKLYDAKVKPALAKKSGGPKTPQDVAAGMKPEPFWQMFSSLNRTGQEMMWDTLGARIGRQLDDLVERASETAGKKKKRGSLRLNPALDVPRYNSEIHIHCQPGGYHQEMPDTADDVFAGALYDLGAFQYGMGGQGPLVDDVGDTLAKYIKKTWPGFTPKRILDLGCGVGHQTLALVDHFPAAEVHACDLGAPMVRYGHARAEALGKRVHYSQQNAEHTDFPDESFDLVVSAVLFHETSAKAVPNIIRESYRLLKKGGVMAHGDVPEFNKFWPDPYDQFQRDWTTHFNAEPFRGKMRDMDMAALAATAGFKPQNIIETRLPSEYGSSLYAKTHAYGALWWTLAARK